MKPYKRTDMTKCAACGKSIKLSKSQEYKAKWGQKVFYHSGCQTAKNSISITRSDEKRFVYRGGEVN